MHDTVVRLIETYGYLFVFALVGVESMGIPLPGETGLITAAAFAAQGRLSIVGVVAAAAAGAILGDTGGYWIGRTGGLALLKRHGRLVRVDDAAIARVQGFFAKHGSKTVFIGRFIAVLRTWAAFFAGAGGMHYPTFLLYNALGGVTWSVVFGAVGYLFGRNLPALERDVGRASLAVLLLVLLGGGVALWRRRRAGAAAGA